MEQNGNNTNSGPVGSIGRRQGSDGVNLLLAFTEHTQHVTITIIFVRENTTATEHRATNDLIDDFQNNNV